jgi:hypothetical protein
LRWTDIRNGIEHTRRAFFDRYIVYVVTFEVFFVQRPRGVRDDLVDPPTMADDFTAFEVWAQGEEIMLAPFAVWKYTNDEMGLWE